MKKFNNVKFKVGNPAEKINCYVDMLLLAVNIPAPGQSFTPKQNFERTELYRKLEVFKDDDEVELESADFLSVMAAYDVMGFMTRSDEAADMYAYFKKIR